MPYTQTQQVLSLRSSTAAQTVVDKKLCIEIGSHFYTYTISDQSGTQIIDMGCFETGKLVSTADLSSLFEIDAINSTSFVDVVLVHNCHEMVLVPSSVYQPEVNASIIQTIHGDLENWKVMEDDVHQWELYNVYGWRPELINIVAERFPQVRHVQFVTGVLRSLFKSLSIEKEQLIKLYFYQKEMMVVILKDSQLQIAQSFQFETPQDVIYHLLNLVDRLKLDLATVIMEVSGLVDVNSETWKELNKFFIDVQLDEFSTVAVDTSAEESMPAHYYTPFLISPRCV
ncbi:MAG: hypothetical protein RL000_544 [Bacteroidota bacterium]|jgi:hypothetical protein